MSNQGPFRTSGRSETLERLAGQGAEKRRELPQDARQLALPDRRRRLELAVGVHRHNASGWLIFSIFACAFTLASGRLSGGLMALLMVPTVALLSWTWHVGSVRARERAERIAATLAWADRLPFPTEGYAEWIASEEPVLHVIASRVLGHEFEAAVHAVDPAATVEFLDERTARVEIPPRKVEQGDTVDWLGDIATLTKLTEQLLVPLHAEIGIERVAMGGRMHRT